MIRRWGIHTLVIVMAITLVAAPITAIGTGAVHAPDDSTTYELTDSVSVWERAALPLRFDSGDAAKTAPNGNFFVNYEAASTGDVPARQDTMNVYSADTPVTLSLSSVTGAGTETLSEDDTQLVIARLDQNADQDSLPTTMGEARDMFNAENGNENTAFRVKNTGQINSDGSLSTEVTFDTAGTYAVFLATVDSGNGFEAPNDDLSISGDATIVGMDQALVESQPAQTDIPSSVEPGENIDVTLNDLPANADATVLVYEQSTWRDSQTILEIKEEITRDTTAEDFTIAHSITSVNGVASFDGPVTVAGTTFNDDRISGDLTAPSILDGLITEANDRTDQELAGPNLNPGTGSVLHASAAGKANIAGSSTTLTVETLEDWSTGTYQYVVLTGNTAGDIETAEGTLEVEESTSGPDPTPNPDPDPSEPDEPTDPPAQNPGTVSGGGPGASITQDGSQVTVTLPSASANERVRITPGNTQQTLNTFGSAMNEIDIGFSENVAGSMSLQPESEADVTEGSVSADGDLGYFRINHDFSDESVTDVGFTFQVSKQRLAERNLNPGDIALHRLEADGWNELETTEAGETETAYTFRAVSPGLSLFSISTKNASQPAFEVTDASVSPTETTVGETVTVNAAIRNSGSGPGNFTAELAVDGEVVSTETVRIPAGEERTVTFTRAFQSAGEYDISVSGTAAGTVTVTEDQTTPTPTSTQPPTSTPTSGTTTGPSGQGGFNAVTFGVILLIVAGLGGFLLYRRNQ